MPTTRTLPPPVSVPPRTPALHTGDRLTAAEFERRYQAMPEVKKAELIEGVVYMPSPVSDEHSGPHADTVTWLNLYSWMTPGVVGRDNGTLRLDLDNRPQPDAFLRILETHGGQLRLDEEHYVADAPELVAEVAVSSVGLDLHGKLHVYRRTGVREYVVWRVEDAAVDWFILREGRFDRLALSADGVYRSEVFPGLWLDPQALVRGEVQRVLQVSQQGIASPEHAAFVARLHAHTAARPS